MVGGWVGVGVGVGWGGGLQLFDERFVHYGNDKAQHVLNLFYQQAPPHPSGPRAVPRPHSPPSRLCHYQVGEMGLLLDVFGVQEVPPTAATHTRARARTHTHTHT